MMIELMKYGTKGIFLAEVVEKHLKTARQGYSRPESVSLYKTSDMSRIDAYIVHRGRPDGTVWMRTPTMFFEAMAPDGEFFLTNGDFNNFRTYESGIHGNLTRACYRYSTEYFTCVQNMPSHKGRVRHYLFKVIKYGRRKV